MKPLNENATNEEIVNKINEIIDYIYKWQMSMLEEEIRKLKYRQERDKFFEDCILPHAGGHNVIQ